MFQLLTTLLQFSSLYFRAVLPCPGWVPRCTRPHSWGLRTPGPCAPTARTGPCPPSPRPSSARPGPRTRPTSSPGRRRTSDENCDKSIDSQEENLTNNLCFIDTTDMWLFIPTSITLPVALVFPLHVCWINPQSCVRIQECDLLFGLKSKYRTAKKIY